MTQWNEEQDTLRKRIEINPDIMTGKPVIRGTRVPVESVVRMLAQGMTTEDIITEYPHLNRLDVQAALLYAAENLEDSEVFPVHPE